MSAQPITCQEIVELVTEYLEGTLAPEALAAFDAHLEVCPGCVTYVEQIRETVRLTGTLTEEQLEPGMREGLLAAFRDFKRG
jgi:anti-sigma factor RsiW